MYVCECISDVAEQLCDTITNVIMSISSTVYCYISGSEGVFVN